MLIRTILEYNSAGCLVYAADYPGAAARGRSPAEAYAKLPDELAHFSRWQRGGQPGEPFQGCGFFTVLAKDSPLHVEDADSDVIFPSERLPMTMEDYRQRKALALRSAADFQALYDSVPDKSAPLAPVRESFYGPVPNTAEAMYQHTMCVNRYYFGEIGIEAENGPDILSCRARAFAALEQQAGFLAAPARTGSYDELWSLAKVLRRFLWHDRLHARAMYRRAAARFGSGIIADPFCFAAGPAGSEDRAANP